VKHLFSTAGEPVEPGGDVEEIDIDGIVTRGMSVNLGAGAMTARSAVLSPRGTAKRPYPFVYVVLESPRTATLRARGHTQQDYLPVEP